MPKRWLGIALCTLWPLAAGASWFGANFSADVYQQAPQQPPMSGRMYVDGGKIRSEMSMGVQAQVEIFNPEQGSDWLLDPNNKVYMQRPLPVLPKSMQPGGHAKTPCEGMPGTECTDLGSETLNGRPAHKWGVKGNVPTRPLDGFVWVDEAHNFPVKQEFSGKVVSEMRYLGNEDVSGRHTEKWAAQTTDAQGRVNVSTQWYDPQLNMAIRQQMDGGYVRELRNIQIGPQPAELFSVPADYRLVEPPPAGGYAPR